jgi:cell wall assembly regulator SMI1
MTLHTLLAEISRHHFPRPPATPRQLAEFEARVGWRLDEDLRSFYLHCNGAELFRRPDSPYRILSLSEITRARVALFANDSDEYGTASWFVICYVQDGNYIGIDVGQPSNGSYPVHDCFHELLPGAPQNKRIAHSFSDFLARALRSDGHLYWLKKGWALQDG